MTYEIVEIVIKEELDKIDYEEEQFEAKQKHSVPKS